MKIEHIIKNPGYSNQCQVIWSTALQL